MPDPGPQPPPKPLPRPPSIWSQALLFLGPIVACGGMLAIIRTGEHSLFYASLAPVGLIMSLVGWWLKYRTRR